MKKLIILAVLLAVGLVWPTSLEAQQASSEPACASYKVITGELKGKYKEGQAAIGLSSGGQVFQIFSTKSGSSWTVLMTKPGGETCIMAAGKHLELIKTLEGISVSFPTEK